MQCAWCICTQGAFPHNCNSPFLIQQFLDGNFITLCISLDLVGPELSSRLWNTKQGTSLMAVPETAVHKNYGPPSGKNDIRAPRQILPKQAEAEASRMQVSANKQFRLCVTASNACHHPRARFLADLLAQRPNRLSRDTQFAFFALVAERAALRLALMASGSGSCTAKTARRPSKSSHSPHRIRFERNAISSGFQARI